MIIVELSCLKSFLFFCFFPGSDENREGGRCCWLLEGKPPSGQNLKRGVASRGQVPEVGRRTIRNEGGRQHLDTDKSNLLILFEKKWHFIIGGWKWESEMRREHWIGVGEVTQVGQGGGGTCVGGKGRG